MTETYPQNRRLGYARVSTYGQTLDAQLEQLRGAGCTKIYREKVTGTRADRRQLLDMLKHLAPGDTVIVTRIDRLARLTCSPLSGISWTPRRNSGHSRSRGPTPAPAPGA
jgi:DNA invertase Pin-like site-specific DNA recombinase